MYFSIAFAADALVLKKKQSAAAAVNAKCFFVQHILRILEFTIGLDLRPKYVQFHVGQVQGEKKNNNCLQVTHCEQVASDA